MKPRRFSSFFPSSFVIAAIIATSGSSFAAKTWTGATDGTWTTTTNWLEGALPGTTETAIFDANSVANLSIALGANQNVRGITLSNPAGPVTITTGSNLTVGFNGINMSGATSNLTISSGVTLADGGAQNWTIATGRTLTLAATPTKTTVAACPLTVSTTGTAVFTSNVVNTTPPTTTATTNLIIDTANNPYVTYGANDWAGLNAGTVVASTYTAADGVTNVGLVAGVVNTVTGNLTGINPTDVAAIRFNEPTPYDVTVSNSGTARTMTARGILVTANSGGGSIGGNLRSNGSIRPSRTSGNPSFNIIQNSASDFTIGAGITNASSNVAVRVVKSGPGKVILLQNNSHSAGTFISEGTMQYGDGSAVSGFAGLGFPGSGDIVNNGALIIKRASDVTLVNNISGTGPFTKDGSGQLSLTTSVSTFTGNVNIVGGTLAVTTMSNLGAGTVIDIQNGATFKFLGVIDPSARTLSFGSSGAGFDTNGLAVTLANPIGSGSTGGVTKKGAGSLALAADNTYSGGTTVDGGTLLATNLTGSATGTGAVTVNTGAFIGGTGTVTGDVTVASGGGIAPGTGVGTLTVNSLSLGAGSVGNIEFNASPNNDRIAVTSAGGLQINGGAFTLLQEGTTTPFATAGTYNLFSYSGSISGTGVSSLSVANPQPGFNYAFGTSGGFVTLTITTSGVVSEWAKTGGDSWNLAGSWNNSTVPNSTGATANLFSIITGPANITLDGAKTVGAISFNSPLNAYTITAGTGGALSLNNGSNPSLISNLGGNHVISTDLTLSSSTSLTTVNALDGLTLGGVVSGIAGKTLTKTGPGLLFLSGSNTFAGNLTLNGGTTTFANNGLGTGNLAIDNSSLVWASGNTQDISNRTVTFGANPVTFDTNGNDVSLANAIGDGGAAAFTKAGTGILTLASDATFSGQVTISGGVLQLGTGGSTGLVIGNIVNNGQLDIKLSAGAVVSNTISGTGSFVHAGTADLTLGSANTFTGQTTIPSSTASLLLGNPLNLQGSTLQYDAAGGTLNFGSLSSATLGGLSGDKSLALDNTLPGPVALTIGANGQNTTYSGVLSGSGSLVKAGVGTTSLTAAQTFTGSTTVNAGVLDLAENGALANTTVTVAGTATLQLSGSGSSLTASGLVNINNGGGFFPVLQVTSGTVTLSGGLSALGNANNGYRVQVDGGTLTANTMQLGRGALGFTTEAAAIGNTGTGLYVNGGTVDITGNLDMGTNTNTNSSVSARVDSGLLTVAGKITVGLNNGGRWSILQVSGGEFRSTDTVDGLVLGGPFVGNAVFAVTSGVSTVERIQFGQGTLAGTSVVRLSGGELYLGSGGINQGSATNVSEFRLAGGTLGAKVPLTTPFPMNVAAPSTIKAADALDASVDITLSGALTGVGGISKTGAGTLTLTGDHTYTGATIVQAGILSVTNKTFADAAEISIQPTGTLNLNFTGGDRVGILTLDGVQQPDGIYGRVGAGIPGVTEIAGITGDGLLYVNTEVINSPYDSWAQTNITAISPLADATPGGDPDNDGVKNILEFVLGGNPLASSTSVVPTLAVNATNFVFTFNRTDASEAEALLQFQWGAALSTWPNTVAVGAVASGPDANGVTVSVDEGTPSSNPDVIIVTVPKTNAVAGKLFGRLQAVK